MIEFLFSSLWCLGCDCHSVNVEYIHSCFAFTFVSFLIIS